MGNVIWFGWVFNFHHLLKSVFVLSSKIKSVVFLFFNLLAVTADGCFTKCFLALHECFVYDAFCCGKCTLLSKIFLPHMKG